MRKSYRNKSKRRNGGATVMPLSYYNPLASEPDAAAGRDLLKANPSLGIRPKIGGKRNRTKKRRIRRYPKKRGGFVPSIMSGFVSAASNYIAPIALFAGYKLMTRKQKKGRRTRKH